MAVQAPKTNDFLEAAGKLAVEFLVLSLSNLDIRKPIAITGKVRYEVQQNQVLIYMPFYYRFIESGRKPFVKRVPISALLDWIQRKSVPVPPGWTQTNLAFAIQTGIYQNGIKAKPFVAEAVELSTEELSIRIFGEVDEYLKSTIKLLTTIPTPR